MIRQNFTRAQKVAIKARATKNGVTYCEAPGCGVMVKSGGEVHHLDMDAMKLPEAKTRKLTLDDGGYWCEACHDPETARQRTILAEALAREASHAGIKSQSKSRRMSGKEKPPRPKLIVAPGGTELQRRYKTI